MSVLRRHGPESPIAWSADRVVTAADLRAHIEGFSGLLEPSSSPPGEESVLVICRDRYRFAVALLAAWERGYSVALPPSPALEVIQKLRVGVRTVIHDVDGVGRGIDVRDATVVAAARAALGRVPYGPPPELPAARRMATVYTSGSTGAHAACEKTTSQLLGEADALAKAFQLPTGARFVPMVPTHHIYGLLFGVLVPLVSGGSFYRGTPLHAAELEAVLRDPADVLVTVPAHLRGFMIAEKGELPHVPRVFSSAAPLPKRVAAAVRERFDWTVTEVFGSSETGGIGWRTTGGEGPWNPLPGVSVSSGPDGLLRLRSPFLHPDAEAPYVGADRIEALPDGRFRHLGRADGVLKVGGVRVSLAEVELRLLEIEGVRDAAVLPREVGGARGSEIWAAVAAPGLTAPQIRTRLLRWLAPTTIPRRIRVVERLPRNEAGKLPRTALEALFEQEA